MKRSGFARPKREDYEYVSTPTTPRQKPHKAPGRAKISKTKPRSTTKIKSLKTLRNKADSFLTPIIKKLFPRCLLCNQATQVAHHHVHKSQSSRLRYEISNLINLCNSCHLALHCNESYYASKVVSIKGLEWFRDLETKKNEYVKTDRFFYQENIERLQKINEES